MTAIPLYVVTLYPYDDGSEARFQFDTLDQASLFADMVNVLPDEVVKHLAGDGKTVLVQPWVSGTYENADTAMEELEQWVDDIDPCYGIHNFVAEDGWAGDDPLDGPARCTSCRRLRVDPVDPEPCTHANVEPDDDGSRRFFVCESCKREVAHDGEAWEVVE